jgi:hypothetical protein
MSRRRNAKDIVRLLEDADMAALALTDGRVVAFHKDDRPKLIHLTTRRKDPRKIGLVERWTLTAAAGQAHCDPVLAWWPRGQEVPEWIAL